jgi:predicted metal-binding membrane protein
MANVATDPLAPQRNLILGLLILLAVAAWGVLVWQGSMPGMLAMGPEVGALLFLALWVVMMVAMMFPTAAPMILLFHRIQAKRRSAGQAFIATWIFVLAYLALWSAAGVVAFIAALAGEALLRRAGLSPEMTARIGGGLLVVAGIYQLTPLKKVCLSACRSPMGFVMTSWEEGVGGAVRMGLHHGIACLGCCWLLFAILFPLGLMNVAAMAVITVLIFAEKAFPWGRRAAQVGAAVLIAYGLAVVAVPSLLPTFASGTAMPDDMGGMKM